MLPAYSPLLLLTSSSILPLQKLEIVSLGFQGRLETRNNHVVPRNSRPQKHQKQVGTPKTQPHVLSITGLLSLQCQTAIVRLPRSCLLSQGSKLHTYIYICTYVCMYSVYVCVCKCVCTHTSTSLSLYQYLYLYGNIYRFCFFSDPRLIQVIWVLRNKCGEMVGN